MYCRTLDKQNIYYEVKGNLEAENSIVFLNGLSQTTNSWGLITPFFEENYKIVLIDFIFQGQSDKKGEAREFNIHAVDVLSVLDTLGLYNNIIVGYTLTKKNFFKGYLLSDKVSNSLQLIGIDNH